jgi:high-affinity iron transporter
MQIIMIIICFKINYLPNLKVPPMKRLVIALLLLLSLPGITLASPDLPKLVQLIDYVGVDYRGAVSDGTIINAAEYQEMRDFTLAIAEQAKQLPLKGSTAVIQQLAQQLAEMVERLESPDAVASTSANLRKQLITAYNVIVTPRMPPELSRARQLFAENCVACHGVNGQGDGPMARDLEPKPTDFTGKDRYNLRTLYGLYSTISAGVADTSMRSFDNLSEVDRWNLAFLIGKMAVSPEAKAAGKAILKKNTAAAELAQLDRFTITTPSEAREQYGEEGASIMAYLRANPQALFANASPLDFARETLDTSVYAYRAGKHDEAYKLAVAAYLEGFELVEHRLNTVDSDLRLAIESRMTEYRNLLRDDATLDIVTVHAKQIHQLLDQAAERLNSATLSTGAAFVSAFIIMLREGLEAILVIAALAAFLIKTERRDGMAYLHFGWIGALVLGIFTWLASVYLFDFSGANREITEGVAALVAMAVLFYVGFWMHSKTNAIQWKHFIDGSVQKALSAGTLWGLAGLSFIAVYREVFETILFYQALWVQADVAAQAMLLSGLGSALAALAVLAWLILRYSTRLPLRQFFSATSIFMFVLAVVFAGKGVAALQEAGKLPIHPVSFPRIDLLGIYPNLQTLLIQAGLLLLAVLILWGSKLRRESAA